MTDSDREKKGATEAIAIAVRLEAFVNGELEAGADLNAIAAAALGVAADLMMKEKGHLVAARWLHDTSLMVLRDCAGTDDAATKH